MGDLTEDNAAEGTKVQPAIQKKRRASRHGRQLSRLRLTGRKIVIGQPVGLTTIGNLLLQQFSVILQQRQALAKRLHLRDELARNAVAGGIHGDVLAGGHVALKQADYNGREWLNALAAGAEGQQAERSQQEE